MGSAFACALHAVPTGRCGKREPRPIQPCTHPNPMRPPPTARPNALLPARRSEAAAAAAVASAAPPGLAWPSLADYWRTGSKVVWDAVTKRDLLILHVPRERMRALKAQAAGG